MTGKEIFRCQLDRQPLSIRDKTGRFAVTPTRASQIAFLESVLVRSAGQSIAETTMERKVLSKQRLYIDLKFVDQGRGDRAK